MRNVRVSEARAPRARGSLHARDTLLPRALGCHQHANTIPPAFVKKMASDTGHASQGQWPPGHQQEGTKTVSLMEKRTCSLQRKPPGMCKGAHKSAGREK